jgi:hypothetical protein
MPFSKDPFDRSYDNQPVNDLIFTLNHAAEKAEGHIAFQGPVAEYVSLPPRLRELAAKLGAARDAGQAADVKDLVAQAVQALNFNANHIFMFSTHRNDPTITHNAGYAFKQKGGGKGKVNLLDLVPEIHLKHMKDVTGGMLIVAKVAKTGASLELQMTTTPEIEDSWRGIGDGTFTKTRIERRGLEPATKIYVRGRYHADGSVGRWSQPVSQIVL